MKINEKINYVSPKVEVVKVKIEKGFAPSDVLEDVPGLDTPLIPDFPDDF